MSREFGGIEFVSGTKNVFGEHFEEFYNSDDKIVYISKKTFHHEEEGLEFDYKYVASLFDMEYMSGEEGEPFVVELMLVPAFDSLYENNKVDLMETFSEEDYSNVDEGWKYIDIAEYSFGVRMGYKAIEVTPEEREEWDKLQAVQDTLEDVANAYETIDNLRGFYLDRAWNMIGTTGWDTLKNAINGEQLFKFL